MFCPCMVPRKSTSKIDHISFNLGSKLFDRVSRWDAGHWVGHDRIGDSAYVLADNNWHSASPLICN